MEVTPIHIFGIRHHGPGSARSLRQALEALEPDCVLIEGPPDAEEVLELAAEGEMMPPVALLVYVPEEPRRAVHYPFAVFSPEWQAIEYGLARKLPVRFIDLPQAIQLAQAGEEMPALQRGVDAKPQAAEEGSPAAATPAETNPAAPVVSVRQDPLQFLAEAAGYGDGERWWEQMIEERGDGKDVFAAILEAMGALREAGLGMEPDPAEKLREDRREAYMRQSIRAAQKEGFQKIAVICGAWHAPVLAKMPPAKEDAALLKGLPRVKVAATWVPWTYGRLTTASGYGAGVRSPGWYQHLWESTGTPQDLRVHGPSHLPESSDRSTRTSIGWMTRVARLLRAEDLDASSASVIESVRLSESLAAMRGRSLPGLSEMNEAALTVFCFGNEAPMRLIHDKLIVGQRLGEVPANTPMVPLQQDVASEQKRLRFPPEESEKVLDLDLRKPNDLDRSRLLHRLALLGVPWGIGERTRGKAGTFHEVWRVRWEPEFAVRLIEAAAWGNTVPDAATAYVRSSVDRSPNLPTITALLDKVLLADLPDAVQHLMARLQAEAALASDVAVLMNALPPLANVMRYGNVRKTDVGTVGHVIDGLVARICIGLVPATASLNDEAAALMYQQLTATHGALALLQNPEHQAQWHAALRQLADRQGLHGLIAGRATRLLLDAGALSPDEAAGRMGLALSVATDPPQAAGWVEGFLRGSGLLLLHDEALWQVLDEWVSGITGKTFTALLPLLRRTFATFDAAERRQMGERVRRGAMRRVISPADQADFNQERAEATLPLLGQLLGITPGRGAK